jgi:hypothetical protein
MQNTMRGAFELEIDGKKYNCHLNLNAFRILTQKFKVKLSDLEKATGDNPLEIMPQIAWCGCLNAAIRKQEKFDVDFDYFAAMLLDGPEAVEFLSERIAEVFAPEAEQEEDEEAGN